MKHFKLTTETKITSSGVTIFRIEATGDFKSIKKGEKGGFVEKEENIYGDAWISGNARISGNAWISGDARIYDDAWIKSPLQIQGTKYFVNECKKGFLKIGCFELSFSEWKSKCLDIAKQQGFTDAEIKEYELYVNLAISLSEIKAQ